jgi:hypothetical protein
LENLEKVEMLSGEWWIGKTLREGKWGGGDKEKNEWKTF